MLAGSSMLAAHISATTDVDKPFMMPTQQDFLVIVRERNSTYLTGQSNHL